MVGVVGSTEAEHFSVDLGTAGLGVFEGFEHEQTSAFTHDKAGAGGVEGTGSLVGLVLMVGAEGLHGSEAGNAHAADGGFSATGDDGVGTAEHELVIGTADGVQGGSAGTGGNHVDALGASLDGNEAGGHVGDHHGDVEGGHAAGAGGAQLFMEIFKGLEAAEAHTQHNANAVGIVLVDNEAGILHEVDGGAHSELAEAVHLTAFLGVDVGFRFEILDFARDVGGIIGGVEERDGADAGLTGKQGFPAGLDVVAQGGDGRKASDNDTFTFHSDVSVNIGILIHAKAGAQGAQSSSPYRRTSPSCGRRADLRTAHGCAHSGYTNTPGSYRSPAYYVQAGVIRPAYAARIRWRPSP